MSTSPTSVRYSALDALRGLTIAMMILVNTPGSWQFIYWPFEHADWNGCTPTDLVFPFFLFVVGASMFFSFRKNQFVWTADQGLKILRRTLIIFAIGLIFNAVLGGQTLSDLRIMGVLQRIALAYAFGAVIVLCVSRKAMYAIAAALLVGYWALLYFAGDNSPYSLAGNVVLRADNFILGAAHLWLGKGVPFDPEGLLSTLPSIVNVLIGFEIARVLSTESRKWRSVGFLVVGGLNALVIGLLWSLWFPLNKSLWTSSFVVYSAGYFALVLAFFIWLLDIKRWDVVAKPLLIYGANPLFIYVLAAFWVHLYGFVILADGNNLYDGIFLWLTHFMQPLNASLLFGLLHVGLFWCVSLVLYKNEIIIKV